MVGKQKKRGGGIDRKGRTRSRGKFVRIGHGMAVSPAWRSLSGSAVKYYVELRNRYNGSNNGKLHLSCGQAAKLLHMSETTAVRAQRELEEKGFIHRTQQGSWYNSRATTWALTDECWPGQPATNEWKNWRP